MTTATVTIHGEARTITIDTSDLFLAGPTCSDQMSAFIGEDIRRAKVLRHMDLPIPSIVYSLRDGRVAQKLIKSGGEWYSISIFANVQEFNAHTDQNTCIFDPETGRRRS